MMSRSDVPASAVNVNSLGSYSRIPVSFEMQSFTPSEAASRGLVPAPTASNFGVSLTA